jgi:serine/threonine protein kinase
MAAPTTIDSFLELVRKSGLVDPQRLEAFVCQAPSANPREMAARLVKGGCLTQFQVEQLLLGKWRGFTLGKFKVLERLGIGGNGTVYLCEHLVVRRKVAIKVLPTAKAANPAVLARFFREARAAGALDHPNLVKAHDIDQDNGLYFLVMDFVDGINLQELIGRTGPLDPIRAAQYVAQAAQGLEFAHQAGLVHRDVKPANILLDRHGVIRILDLGLARFYCDQDDPLTLRYDEKTVLGTADYVAPEQALNSHDVDGRADIYGLGATFHFLLTAQPPFPGGKVAQKLIWHQVKQPTPVRAIRPEVPEAMAAVLTRMMAKAPAERFQTAGAVVAALAPWLEPPVPLPDESELPRLSPAARGPNSESSSSSLSRIGRSAAQLRPPSGGTSATGWDTASSSPAAPASFPAPVRARAAQARPVSMVDLVTPDAPASAGVPPSGGLRREDRLKAELQPKDRLKAELQHEDRLKAELQHEDRLKAELQPEDRLKAELQHEDRLKAELQPTAAPCSARKKLIGRRARFVRLGLLLLAGLVAGSAVRWLVGRPAAVPPAPPPALVVDRSGAPGTFPTIAAALAQAPPDARIVVRADAWEEALHVPADGAAAVRIEGAAPGGGPVRWRAPRDYPDGQPLLRVVGRAGLHLRGMVLDGEDRLANLVLLAGPCPDLTLEDLHLIGFRHSAVTLRACSGTADRPVTLRHVRATASRPAASALSIEGRADEINQHLHVRDCRLEGPYQAAVVLDGPAEGVFFTHNRIWNAADAFLYRKAVPAHPLGLTLAGNTVCAVEKVGLRFETLPPAGRSRVELIGNLFARTGTLARVDDFAAQPVQTAAGWLWLDATRPAGETRPERGCFRKTFAVAGAKVEQGTLHIAADSVCTVWLNGERVGECAFWSQVRHGAGVFRTCTHRVQAISVTPYLRPGLNLLAVEVTNTTGAAGLLAQLEYTCTGAAPVTVAGDATWKAARDGAAGWTDPGFNDGGWPAAKVVAPYGKGELAWQDLVWDGVVQERLGGKAGELFPQPSGNVCDWQSREGFPLLNAAAHPFELPTYTADDGRFLRYPATSPLAAAGAPGVPPAERTAPNNRP